LVGVETSDLRHRWPQPAGDKLPFGNPAEEPQTQLHQPRRRPFPE
jgi:hypothetical protein